jgi:hypothetical protein
VDGEVGGRENAMHTAHVTHRPPHLQPPPSSPLAPAVAWKSSTMATQARRLAATTSLAKFARQHSPDPASRANDFCNAFWGLGDAGVEVLFARMRGAGRTMEELRGFWKERRVPAGPRGKGDRLTGSLRAAIEDEYAKRMSKLAKMAVGRDEIGYATFGRDEAFAYARVIQRPSPVPRYSSAGDG